MLQCIIFCQPASLDCQNICRSTTSAVWPYYCVMIKWKPGGSIVWTLNFTNRSPLTLPFLLKELLLSLYWFSAQSCFGSLLTKTSIFIENTTRVLPSWQTGGQSSEFVILSSFLLLLLWECWMLHCSVLHPFLMPKNKQRGQPLTSCTLADRVRLKLTSGTVFYIYTVCISRFTYLGIAFKFLQRCYALPSPVMYIV